MLKILITAVVVAVLTVFIMINFQNIRSGKGIFTSEKLIDVSDEITTKDNISETKSDVTPETSKAVTLTISKGKTLDLSGQGITKVPAYIFDRTEIQELNLSNNNIDGALQAEVRHLQDLKILNLSNNQFTGVPAEVGQLKSLEVLDLSNNKLTGLPYELGNLSNLKVLNLKGNNYSIQDLNIIKENLPASTVIQVN